MSFNGIERTLDKPIPLGIDRPAGYNEVVYRNRFEEFSTHEHRDASNAYKTDRR